LSVDLSLSLRQGVVSYLRAHAGVGLLVPSEQIYGERPPSDHSWPYVRYGWDTVVPFSAQCVDGGEITFSIHTFAQGSSSDVIKVINAAIVAALDDAELELDEGWAIDLTFVRAQTLPEGPDAFHGVLDFTALTGVAA